MGRLEKSTKIYAKCDFERNGGMRWKIITLKKCLLIILMLRIVSGLQSMLGNIGKQKAYELVREGTIKAIKVGKLYRIPKINVIAFLTQ